MDYFKHFKPNGEVLNEKKECKTPVNEEIEDEDLDDNTSCGEDDEFLEEEYSGEGEVYELRGLNEEEIDAIHKALNLNEKENLSEATKWVVRDGKKKIIIS